jgi:hypothetical protein
MELTMRKLPYLAAGLVLAILAVTFVGKSNTSATDGVFAEQPRISIDELHRRVDISALPAAQMDAEPF